MGYNQSAMAGFWNNLFGGSPESLIGRADSLAAEELWPEAIETLEKALGRLPENDRATRAEMEGRIAAYVDGYQKQLAEAIPRLIEDGEGEQAEELLSIALAFARDEEEEQRLRTLSAAPVEVEAPEPVIDPRPDHEIDALADSFAEALEPEEKEAVFARPVAFRRGFVLWNEGEYDRAGHALDEFLRQAPHDPYGYLFLGLTFAAAGRREEAEGALEKAVRHEPSLVLATLSLSIVRKELGDNVTIFADSNGSYDAAHAIKIGRVMEDSGIDMFEEPCPFDYLEETKKVADALSIPISGGEQEPSQRP